MIRSNKYFTKSLFQFEDFTEQQYAWCTASQIEENIEAGFLLNPQIKMSETDLVHVSVFFLALLPVCNPSPNSTSYEHKFNCI